MEQVVSAPASASLDPQVKEDEKVYLGLLVRASLLLLSKDFPLEVQRHGARMIEHLLKFRSEELSSADLLNLKVELVKYPDVDHAVSKIANYSEQNMHRSNLLPLSANNSPRSLAAEETVEEYNSVASSPQFSLHLDIFDGPVPIYSLESDKSCHSSSSNTSSTRSGTSNGLTSESSNSNNQSFVRSFGLSSDAQVDYDESELEVQGLMSIDISDNNEVDDDPEDQIIPKYHSVFGTRITVSKKIADFVHPQMLGFDGKAYGNQVNGCLLLVEHNILCQSLVITSCFRNLENKSILSLLFDSLNIIWNQPEWKSTFLCTGFGLSCLLSGSHFLKMVYNVVKVFENELKRSIEEDFTDFIPLLPLFLPLLLQLLRCIHALWKDQISCNLFKELEEAKMLTNGDEDSQVNETRKFLEKIRESGAYNIIGLSMSLDGAFTEILDISSLSAAFVDLDSMEFRHLSKLIHLVLSPLVKTCPREFWKEWMLNLLGPVLRHCEDVLYYAWFSLLHQGRAGASYYFGKLPGSAESIEKLEQTILLEFTRDVSHLFGKLCSPELNNGLSHEYFEDASDKKMIAFQDLDSISSNSLIGYLLVHDCFGRLRMSLFGYWVDDEAATKAIPFCRTLVLLAGVSKDERLRQLILHELLPSVTKRLDAQLPCAIRHLNCKLNSRISDSVNKDLIVLCQESYNCLYSNVHAQSQDLVVEYKDRNNAEDNFSCWFTKLKEDLRKKACSVAPKEFKGGKVEWNWEFEDELGRYIPVYIDMLNQVDAMEDVSAHDYFNWPVLLQKLKPEFRSKYAIKSSDHHHLMAISYMRRRKFNSTAQVRNHKIMCEILSKLIVLTPYIKGSDCSYSVIDRLEQSAKALFSSFDSYDVEKSVDVLLDSVLYLWEPQFHPLIREGHKDLLLWVIGELTSAKEFNHFQPLAPDPEDFPPHLKPHAMLYIANKLKTSLYALAEQQLHMHEEYDGYLAYGKLDDYIYKYMTSEGYFSGKDVDSWAVPQQFSDLDRDLIKLSLQRRAAIVQIDRQVHTYLSCLSVLLEDKLLKDRVIVMMNELELEGFFDTDSCHINWENKRFTELVDNFSNEVFKNHSLPKHYIIRGIVDCRTFLIWRDGTRRSFEQVVSEACDRLTAYLPQFWRDTRHYKHYFYDIVQKPLEKIFLCQAHDFGIFSTS
ncbi:hypothetical protein ACP70R_002487 [Stipagrostis hirtigluma subsp. patula]